ncbi:MAG: hypothetical protein GX989_06050 [Firmicutes bacterium]|nr:hypothetical protein [Bacillota bacterium]
MELIIILIVLRVIYSIFQFFQGKGGEPRSPQRPRRPTVPSPPSEVEDPPGKMLTDFWEKLKEPDEKQLAAGPATKPALQPKFVEAEEKPWRQMRAKIGKTAQHDLPSTRDIRRSHTAVSRRKKVGRREQRYVSSVPAPSTLLKKDNLIWGMIALEVLSPPRARNPFLFDRRKRQKSQRGV